MDQSQEPPSVEQAARDLKRLLYSTMLKSSGGTTVQEKPPLATPESAEIASPSVQFSHSNSALTVTPRKNGDIPAYETTPVAIGKIPSPSITPAAQPSEPNSPNLASESALEKSKSLAEKLQSKKAELAKAQSQFVEITQKLISEQSKNTKYSQEVGQLTKQIEELNAKIKDSKRLLEDAVRIRDESELLVNSLCEGIEKQNKGVQRIKTEISELESQLKDLADPNTDSTLFVDDVSVSKSSDDLALREPLSSLIIPGTKNSKTPMLKLSNDMDAKEALDKLDKMIDPTVKYTLLPPRSNDSAPVCLFYNIGSCPEGDECKMSHECGHCGSREHPYTKCLRRPHICSFFNKALCKLTDCFRQHICLMCHEDHAMVNCPYWNSLEANSAQKDFDTFCLNWNASGVCKLDGCGRTHACLHCMQNHPSLDCTNAVHKALTSKKNRILLTKYVTDPQYTDHNSDYGSFDKHSKSSRSLEHRTSRPSNTPNGKRERDITAESKKRRYDDYPRQSGRDYDSNRYKRTRGQDEYGEFSRSQGSYGRDDHRNSYHPSSSSSSRGPTSSGPPRLDQTCHLWNQTGSCKFGIVCRFSHICSNCGMAGHPAFACTGPGYSYPGRSY